MPSLNLRNALKRNPNRLTLKQRAAALKATAGRVIRRRAVEVAPAAPGADPRLAAMVAELLEARRKLNDPAVPDGPEADAIGDRETALSMAVYRFPARSIHDMAAKLPFLREEAEDAGRAWDVRRGEVFENSLPGAAWAGLLRDIEHLAGVTPAAETAPDPILAAIEASKAAHAARDAWSQRFNGGAPLSAADFAEEDKLNGVQSLAHDAVIATVPTTSAGRLALLEYLRWQMGLYGMADGSPPDAGSAFWPDAYKALKAALAFESGPQSGASPEAAAIADQIISTWRAFGRGMVAGMPDDPSCPLEDDVEMDRLFTQHNATLDLADRLPATMENLFPKALALVAVCVPDLLDAGKERASYTADGRLAFDVHTAITGQTMPVPAPKPAEPASAPKIRAGDLSSPVRRDLSREAFDYACGLDLSGVSFKNLWRLCEVFHAADEFLSPVEGESMFDKGTAHPCWDHTAGGVIIAAEVNRMGCLRDEMVNELRRRSPQTESERDIRLEVLIGHEIRCNGSIRDKALLAEINQAWGA